MNKRARVEEEPGDEPAAPRAVRPRRARLVQLLTDDAKRRELHSAGIRFHLKNEILDADAIRKCLQSLDDIVDGATFLWKPAVDREIAAVRAACAAERREKLQSNSTVKRKPPPVMATAAAAKDDSQGVDSVALMWNRLLERMRPVCIDELAATAAKNKQLHRENEQLQAATEQEINGREDEERLRGQFVREKSQLERQVESLTGESTALKEKYRDVVKERDGVSTALAKVTEEKNASASALATLTRDYDEAKRQREQVIATTGAEVQRWKDECGRLRERLKSLQIDVARVVHDRETIRASYAKEREHFQQQREQEQAASAAKQQQRQRSLDAMAAAMQRLRE
jgi:hypothetical protein